MTRPISPREVASLKARTLPDAVVEAWNKLIALHYTDNAAGRGYSRVTQAEAVEALLPLVPDRVPEHNRKPWLAKEGWLDIEPMYRARGWLVRYDRPGYNESYSAVFKFEAWTPKL